MNVREELSSGLGIVVGAAVAALTWFFSSPLLGVVSGVLLGTGVSELVRSRTQKRIWKRELARNIDAIYAPLYREVSGNLQRVAGFNARTGYNRLEDTQWDRISSEYVKLFIGNPLRTQLATLYALIEKFNSLIQPVYQEVDRIVADAASSVLGSEIVRVSYWLKSKAGGDSSVPLAIAALFGQHPEQVLMEIYPNIVGKFCVSYNFAESNGASSSRDFDGQEDLKRFDGIFVTASKSAQRLDSVKSLRATLGAIESSASAIQATLISLIKEPWSV